MHNKNMELDLFSLPDDDGASYGNKLDVVKMDFLSTETVTWKELFSGYDELHAITYSSGVNFIYELSKLFHDMEVIFGCEEVMSYSLQEIIAYQSALIEKMRSTSSKSKIDLLDRINDNSIHFYVANKQLSHEKIYLLKANDGRKRVITGSANMSYTAFSGRQRENISYIDGDRAYDWYFEVFNGLKDNCTDEISKKAYELSDADENIDALPISETIKKKKLLVIEPTSDLNDEIEFVLDIKKKAKELEPLMPKVERKKKRIVLQPDDVTKIRRRVIEEKVKENELRSEYPQLVIDVEKQNVTLNGMLLELNPRNEDIKNDIDLFIKYMDGYKDFHGDYEGMQLRYFEFANWFFCSPFMAVMRDMAARYDQNRLPYPVFGLLYGKSKAGKTSFLETLLKMMIGQKPKLSAPDFTRKSIEQLKNTVLGAPIIVDDLTNVRFNQHAIETIKNDDFGVASHNTHYPAVIISANEDVKAVAPEVIRRTVICRVEAGLTNTEVMKSSIVRYVQHNIGTAFYREYLRRMIEALPELLDVIKDDEIVSAPDILQVSSQVLVSIISEYVEQCPTYVRNLNLENYFSEQVTGKYAIKSIQDAWKISKDAFTIKPKTNELRYNAGTSYDADRIIKELPENLEAHKTRDTIVMNLDEAKQFFEIDFKLPWYKILFQ